MPPSTLGGRTPLSQNPTTLKASPPTESRSGSRSEAAGEETTLASNKVLWLQPNWNKDETSSRLRGSKHLMGAGVQF